MNFFLTLITILFLSSCSSFENKKVADIQKYDIELPKNFIDQSGGFEPAIGSSIDFSKKLDNGNLEFFAISDRGPNYPIKDTNKIVMFYPQFSPTIVKIEIEPNVKAIVKSFMNIKYSGKAITGLNVNQEGKDEEIYDANLNKIVPNLGLDTESIAIMKNGNFVIGDEYYPSISIVDSKTGNIIKRLTPGNGLPEVLKYRNFNRGFEALAVAPNGKIYAILEGVLNLDAHSNKNGKFIRLLEIDLEASNVRTYAYPFDYLKYKDSSKVKIGDIAAIDNENFLIVEQGPTIDKKYTNIIYKISLQDATDISNIKLANGQELEYGDFADLKNIQFITKKLILSPRNYGWEEDKLEGLTIIDSTSIAITNDTDFAIKGYKSIDVECVKGREHTCKKIVPIMDQKDHKTKLWIIKFTDKL